jgi:hypothetical protein
MPVVLVIIMVVAWIVILGPSLVKRRLHDGDGITSISHFHRQLRVLEHSAPPPIVAPAYRLRSIDGTGEAGPGPGYSEAAKAPRLTVVGADQLPRPALAFLGDDPADAPFADGGPPRAARTAVHEATTEGLPRAGLPSKSVDLHPKHLARRRRRDTLGVLTVVFVGTFMIGFVPGAGSAWIVTLVSGVALAAYVALLVHLRRMAEERERKLHYLRPDGTRGGDPAGGIGLSVTTAGRYAHPSNQVAAAH